MVLAPCHSFLGLRLGSTSITDSGARIPESQRVGRDDPGRAFSPETPRSRIHKIPHRPYQVLFNDLAPSRFCRARHIIL